jgi:hypothetical protein
MLKRAIAVFLWLYAGWYAGALIAFFLRLDDILGPIIGVAAAVLFAGDPRRLIWSRRSTSSGPNRGAATDEA